MNFELDIVLYVYESMTINGIDLPIKKKKCFSKNLKIRFAAKCYKSVVFWYKTQFIYIF